MTSSLPRWRPWTHFSTQRRTDGDGGAILRPRLGRFAERRRDATLALISTPGQYAFAEAMDALDAGLRVMLFTDNVPVEQEVALKDAAAERGLLVMGPDCGTAVVGGVGLGLRQRRPTRPGRPRRRLGHRRPAADVPARRGRGRITHCLGVGGRDLSAAVGGAFHPARRWTRSTRDPATELIVVVSKPPAPEVAEEVRAHAAQLGTRCDFALLGPGQPDLTAAAERVVARRRRLPWDGAAAVAGTRPARRRTGALRGLFCGGTLCDEAWSSLADRLGPVRSNIPLESDWTLRRRPALGRAPDDRLRRRPAAPAAGRTR